MDNLSPGQAANFLKIPPSTLRLWSRQFARHLSTDAAPAEGRRRSYNADDLKVLTRAGELLRLGKTVEEADRLLGVTPEPEGMTAIEAVTVADLNAALIDAREVVGRLAEELKATRDQADQARADAEAATKTAQEARQEIEEAKARVTSLEEGLQALREGDLQAVRQEAQARAGEVEAGLQSLRDEDLQAVRQGAEDTKSRAARLEADLQSLRDEELKTVKNEVTEARERAARRAESLQADAQVDRDRLAALEERLKAFESMTWVDRLLGRKPKK